MKKIILLLFLGLIIQQTYGQTNLKGQLINKNTGEHIIGAHITSENGRITLSDETGQFEFLHLKTPTRLRITHVAYGIIEHLLDSIPSGLLVIRIEPDVSKIEEVQISGDRLRILTKKDQFSIQEFAITNGLIWFIGHVNNQANRQRLFLANLYADTLASISINRAESLYMDVFHNIHLVLKDTVYQLFSPQGESIELLYPIAKEQFFSIMADIEAALNNKLVFSEHNRRNHSRKIFYIKENDPVRYELTIISDTLEASRIKADEVRDMLARKYVIPELYNFWTTVRRYTKKGTKFDEVINNQIPYEIFNSGEDLYVLNFLKDSLLQYNKFGKFEGAAKIDFHKEKRLGDFDYKELTFLPDPISNKVFLLERYIASWVLSPVNLENGKVDPRIMIPNFPGMEGICVYNNAVYFTYHEYLYPYYTRLYRYQL